MDYGHTGGTLGRAKARALEADRAADGARLRARRARGAMGEWTGRHHRHHGQRHSPWRAVVAGPRRERVSWAAATGVHPSLSIERCAARLRASSTAGPGSPPEAAPRSTPG